MSTVWSRAFRSITSSAFTVPAAPSFPRRTSTAYPRMAVSGVRSSWDSTARNRSFASAASASRREVSSSCRER